MGRIQLPVLELLHEQDLNDEALLKHLFNMRAANMMRYKNAFTLVFISIHPSSESSPS
ncbi:hypothetical protein J2TS4_26560 [Paenibacillus sp. J2TS4]|nr:hypothetical protein J2TS4_26560 [Paenibacillus sp. J2TS4]